MSNESRTRTANRSTDCDSQSSAVEEFDGARIPRVKDRKKSRCSLRCHSKRNEPTRKNLRGNIIQRRTAGLLRTSSSLHACSMILFGWSGVMPLCPFDQSYATAYANSAPVRLKAVAVIEPGCMSSAGKASESGESRNIRRFLLGDAREITHP